MCRHCAPVQRHPLPPYSRRGTYRAPYTRSPRHADGRQALGARGVRRAADLITPGRCPGMRPGPHAARWRPAESHAACSSTRTPSQPPASAQTHAGTRSGGCSGTAPAAPNRAPVTLNPPAAAVPRLPSPYRGLRYASQTAGFPVAPASRPEARCAGSLSAGLPKEKGRTGQPQGVRWGSVKRWRVRR